jgi:thiosulfate/3-mercaptopyruvate sulfurtransferase
VVAGGLRAWRVLELPLSAAPPPLRPRLFTPRRQPQLALTVQELMAQRDEVLLVDARAAPRFRGEIEPLDTRAGHVPGAVNHPMQSNLAADGRFLGAAELRAQ